MVTTSSTSAFRVTVSAAKLSAAAAHMDAEVKLLHPESDRDYRLLLGVQDGCVVLAAARPGSQRHPEDQRAAALVRTVVQDPDTVVESGDGLAFPVSSADITRQLLTWRGGAAERSSLVEGAVTLELAHVETPHGMQSLLRVHVPGEEGAAEPRHIPFVRGGPRLEDWARLGSLPDVARPAGSRLGRAEVRADRADESGGQWPESVGVTEQPGYEPITVEIPNPTALVLLASDVLRHGADSHESIVITDDGWMMAKVGGQFAVLAGQPRTEAAETDAVIAKAQAAGDTALFLDGERKKSAALRASYVQGHRAVVIPKSMALMAGKQGWFNQMDAKSDAAEDLRAQETEAFHNLMAAIFQRVPETVSSTEHAVAGLLGRRFIVDEFQVRAKDDAQPLEKRAEILLSELDPEHRRHVMHAAVRALQEQAGQLAKQGEDPGHPMAEFAASRALLATEQSSGYAQSLRGKETIIRHRRNEHTRVLTSSLEEDAQMLAAMATDSASHTRSRTGNAKKATESPVFEHVMKQVALKRGLALVDRAVGHIADPSQRAEGVLALVRTYAVDAQRRAPLLAAVVRPVVERYGIREVNSWRSAYAMTQGGENVVEEQVNLQIGQAMGDVPASVDAPAPIPPDQRQLAFFAEVGATAPAVRAVVGDLKDLAQLYSGSERWRQERATERRAEGNRFTVQRLDAQGRVALHMQGLVMEDRASLSDPAHPQHVQYLHVIHSMATGSSGQHFGKPAWYADVDPLALEAAAKQVQAVAAYGPHTAQGRTGAVCTAQLVPDPDPQYRAGAPGELRVPARLRLTAFGVNKVETPDGLPEPATRQVEIDAWTHEGAFEAMPFFVSGEPLRRNCELVNESSVRIGAHVNHDGASLGLVTFTGARAAFLAPQLDLPHIAPELRSYVTAMATLSAEGQRSGRQVEATIDMVVARREALTTEARRHDPITSIAPMARLTQQAAPVASVKVPQRAPRLSRGGR